MLTKVASIGHYEIVKIIGEGTLIDTESYECWYSTGNGALVPGFYLVLWRQDVRTPRYDHTARYFGPFESRQDARRAFLDYAAGLEVGLKQRGESEFVGERPPGCEGEAPRSS